MVDAVKIDSKLHELLALVDALRVGKAREKELAMPNLKSEFKWRIEPSISQWLPKLRKHYRELKNQMVFIGGAVVSLYADDPASRRNSSDRRHRHDHQSDEFQQLGANAGTIGSTWVLSRSVWPCHLQLQIQEHSGGHYACRRWSAWSVEQMVQAGFRKSMTVKAAEEEIQILSAPAYLATKFEAFNGRGHDYRTSHDFEDIIYLLDNRMTIVPEIEQAHPEIKGFLRQEINKILESSHLEEILSAHLHPFVIDERYPIVLGKMKQITN